MYQLQISDLTQNDFRGNFVNYTVYAQDGSSKNYSVAVVYEHENISTNTPLGIPDADLNGIEDTIIISETSLCSNLRISILITGVNAIEYLIVNLTDPDANAYTLYSGGSTGSYLQAIYPEPDPPVTGDLTYWIGKNPTGAWTLKVVETEPSGGGTDGIIESWGISMLLFH